MGAAALVVPSLVALGLPAVNAVGTGAFYATLARIFATCEHLRLRNVRKRTAFYIVLGGVPLTLVTSSLIKHLANTVGSSLDLGLKIAIIIVMLATWTLMLVNLLKNRKGDSGRYYVPMEHFPLRRKLYGIAAGAGVGILIGSTSIGGGVLIVPILVAVFRLSPSNTVGTSTLISVIMSATAAFMYLLGGRVDPIFAVTMFAGAVPGVFLGCRLSVKIPHRILEFILLAVITISLVVMFIGSA
jgi:uncharacterized membrane protein YfcA